jgi:hypothetical protein
MGDKIKIPFRVDVQLEELLWRPRETRWHAQFKFYPLGYFRGSGKTPAAALRKAWQHFQREVSPGDRWWAVVTMPTFHRVRA